MIARRGAGLLLRRLQTQHFGYSAIESPAGEGNCRVDQGCSVSQSGCSVSPSAAAARHYTGSFWDMPASGAKEALHIELQTTREFLPHRGNFSPQFHPHGVLLMPAGLRRRNGVLHDAWDDSPVADVPVLADSVKRKRRMKIRKHKVGNGTGWGTVVDTPALLTDTQVCCCAYASQFHFRVDSIKMMIGQRAVAEALSTDRVVLMV